MSAPDLGRVQRDIEDLVLRVRAIEGATSPYAQQMISEFRELQRRVAQFAEEGTPVSRRELRHIEERLVEIRQAIALKADAKDVDEIQEETKSNRRIVRTALFAALGSLSVGIILLYINRGPS